MYEIWGLYSSVGDSGTPFWVASFSYVNNKYGGHGAEKVAF